MSSTMSATETVEKPIKEAGIAPAWPTTGNRNILISGGAGYIGTHTIVCLLEGRSEKSSFNDMERTGLQPMYFSRFISKI